MSRVRRILTLAAGLTVATVVVGEIVARFGLGLGTPPLSMVHPTIEYLFRPDQDVSRFGNRQAYNAQGMRSGPIPEEGRVALVIGDSVVNGGTLIDQDDLATEIVARQSREVGAPVYVGNVSAGSWGPSNQLAWLEEFGTFRAEDVVLVLSSHDAGDVPTFLPLDPATHPMVNPPLALWEAVTRYLPRYLPFVAPSGTPEGVAPQVSPDAALEALNHLIEALREAGAEVCAIHHFEKQEVAEGMTPQGMLLREALARQRVPVVEDADDLRASQQAGREPFREGIHLTAEGQAILASLIEECLRRPGAG